MTNGHWQYLAHVEPVLPLPRTGSPAQVPVLFEVPTRRVFAVARIVDATSFVYAPVQAQVPTGWRPSMAEPVRQRARVAAYETGAEHPTSTQRGPRLTWWPEVDTPPRRAARVASFATGAEQPVNTQRGTRLTWWPEVDSPVRRRAGIASFRTGAETPVFVAPPVEVIFVAPMMMMPVPRRARVVTIYTGGEDVLFYEFYPQVFQPWWASQANKAVGSFIQQV